MEGIYYSALRPLIEQKIKNRTCGAVGMTSSSTLSLGFGVGWLHLHAKPDSPGLWWTKEASTIPPDSPSWEHHLKGAPVEKVIQQGVDRVIEIHFSSRTPYDAGGIRLIFEGTGRNANIILVRQTDNRILACLRKVLSGVNRFRAISPGVIYKSPPSSGFPPEEWGSEKVQTLFQANVTPRLLYQNLEGVGPASARSIIAHPGTVSETVKELGKQLINENFTPWQTRFGKVPVCLGDGQEIENPLA
ncbi:MAG: NFACT family protein, partial [Candidatus Sabulitectum sp.]|nr:NFACT family protein [Candidatus Sabulitectum sp.]